jgi:uncharacterized protein (UPF0261 family)
VHRRKILVAKKTIVIAATFDTKGPECLFVKELIVKKGFNVTTVDVGTGVRGQLVFTPDYPKEAVVKAAGSSMQEILDLGKIGKEIKIIEIMTAGAIKICQDLYKAGKLDGIVSLGGTMGTALGTNIMKSLPFSVAKVMMSTVASGFTKPFVGTSNIVMVPSVADIIGLNAITEQELAFTAGAVMGMAATDKVKPPTRPLVGVTTLGGTQKAVEQVRPMLEAKGYQFIVFHANGVGGKSMEELVEQGMISAVFDLSPCEVVDTMYHGFGDAGPTRLEIVGQVGVPQLVSVGNLDHIVFDSADKILPELKTHYVHRHGPSIFTLRTQKKDMEAIGHVVVEKLNKSIGPTAVIIPLKGISVLDQVDKLFVDLEANYALFDVLKKGLKKEIEVKEIDCHINDMAFAEEAARMLSRLIDQGAKKSAKK